MNYSAFTEEDVQNGFVHKVYNEDQFNGNWKQLKGALKENWGEFTDDDLLAIEGRTDRFEGKLQERYGERKEEVRAWVDEWLENHPYDAHDQKN
ncbi:MAG: CsbD family protein [Nitrospiraceae bacterium]|nr:CsbD family protein [Nitrospira sp.]MCB9775328.1 CsbD family protein [Nitrospiraceae bacterium]